MPPPRARPASRRRRPSSSPPRRAAAPPPLVAPSTSSTTTSRKRRPPLLLISIAALSLAPLAGAATAGGPPAPNLNFSPAPPDENDANRDHDDDAAVVVGVEKVRAFMRRSQGELDETDAAPADERESSRSRHEAKSQKLPPANGRRERQKRGERQRQKQQQQQQQQQRPGERDQKIDAETEGNDDEPQGKQEERQELQQERQQERQQQQLEEAVAEPARDEERKARQAELEQIKARQAEYDAYMHWCQRVLGIQSVVEIREFEYLDHLQIHWDESECEESDNPEFDWLKQYAASSDSENDVNVGFESAELPTTIVRGLAATHDIQVGDIVLSIPLYSLLSVPTTIDHDPVLSRILGPNARKSYGWTDAAEYELPLLVLAVLHHRSLGDESPIHHYIEILMATSTDSFPFLWTDRELREKTGGDAGEEVRKLARVLRSDLRDIYDNVMGTLVKEKPEWFAPPDGYFGKDQLTENGEEIEWIYSYENFRWAFALVISRHHYLPISDFDDEADRRVVLPKKPSARKADPPSQKMQDMEPKQQGDEGMHVTLSAVSEVVPPANQPTDSWVDLARNEERVTEDDLVAPDDDVVEPQSGGMKHSFLAPLADLINFGPPCLTGSYNADDRAFDLIATCPFSKGQEVTFWYSGDCADVIIANFGFLHPLVPPCDAPGEEEEDWERKSDEWREESELREKELWEAYRKMDLLKEEMAVLESQLLSCDCEDGEKKRRTESAPVASGERAAAEANHKLRIRRINEQAQTNRKMMEELG